MLFDNSSYGFPWIKIDLLKDLVILAKLGLTNAINNLFWQNVQELNLIKNI